MYGQKKSYLKKGGIVGQVIIKNLYGADMVVESVCSICGKTHQYRLKERKICSSDDCFNESKKRNEKKYGNFRK